MYPELIDLVQAARNAGAALNRDQSEIGVLLRLHQLSQKLKTPSGDVPWALVKRRIGLTRPPSMPKIGSLITFVIRRAGGASATHLAYLNAFNRNLVSTSKRTGVPAEVYEKLGDFPHHFMAMALLQAAWLCPEVHIKNGLCSQIGPHDITSMAKEIQGGTEQGKRFGEVENMFCEARAVMDRRGRVWIFFG